jgi:DNA-binding NarL/FixJ family response regulator
MAGIRPVTPGPSQVDIARLSEATVGKHLDNTYARLHVNSRTAAVAKIHPPVTSHPAPTPA